MLVKTKDVSHIQRNLLPRFNNVMCKYAVGMLLAKERKTVDGNNCKIL